MLMHSFKPNKNRRLKRKKKMSEEVRKQIRAVRMTKLEKARRRKNGSGN